MTFREKLLAAGAALSTAAAAYFYTAQPAPFGNGPNHGENPNPTAASPQFSDSIGTYAVVFLKLQNDGTIRVNHAYFQTLCTQPTKSCIDGEVYKLIKKRFYDLNQWRNPDTANYGPLAITNATGSSLISDFNNFYFGRKSRVYVYSDSETLRFDQIWPIMFTQFGVNSRSIADNNQWNKYKKDENKTIKNSKTISIGDISNNSLLYFENEYKTANGTDPASNLPSGKFVNLSINFNMWLKTANGGEIPMVIDPDTGNGVGSPPPP